MSAPQPPRIHNWLGPAERHWTQICYRQRKASYNGGDLDGWVGTAMVVWAVLRPVLHVVGLVLLCLAFAVSAAFDLITYRWRCHEATTRGQPGRLTINPVTAQRESEWQAAKADHDARTHRYKITGCSVDALAGGEFTLESHGADCVHVSLTPETAMHFLSLKNGDIVRVTALPTAMVSASRSSGTLAGAMAPSHARPFS